MKRHLTFLISFLMLFALFAVVSDLEAFGLKSRIIGKWVEVKGHGQIEFLKDGTVIWGSNAGDYKFIGDNRLRLDFKTEVTVFEVSIDKEGALILKESTGGSSRYLTEKAYKVYTAKLDAQMKVAEERRKKAEEARKRAEEEKRKDKIKKIQANFIFTDLTVQDKSTNLMWTRNANIAGKDIGKYEDKVFGFVRELNKQKYAGYSDWMLPTKEEIESLVSPAKSQDYNKNLYKLFNEIGFKNICGNCWYWTASIEGGDAYFLIAFDYVDHITTNYGAMGDCIVWPVRGGQRAAWEKKEVAEMKKRMEERFSFSDLTVIDRETKLMWTRDANIYGKEMIWEDALKFKEDLNQQKYAGYSDWRLPNKKELLTLVNYARSRGYTNKKINELFNKSGFINMQSNNYWTSETEDSYGWPYVWYVDFGRGGETGYYQKSYQSLVILVRDGQ